jgi:hypothetical protein
MCGKEGCDGGLSGTHTIDKKITYACKSCRVVSIRAQHVEPLPLGTLITRLARSDAEKLLRKKVYNPAEAEQLRTEQAVLLSRLDEIADERADGLLTGPAGPTRHRTNPGNLDALTKRQQDQERLRVFDGIPLGTDEVAEKVEALSPDRLRVVIDLLMTVTVEPVAKGGHVFDPNRRQVGWK